MSSSDAETADAEVSRALGALLDDDPVAFYERAPCGYLSTTHDGTIIRVNETFLDWTGHRREDLVGKRAFVDLISPGGRIFHETHYRPLLEMQDRVREIALELVCATGERLPVLANSVLERDADGHPVVVRTAVFDATERRRYERELLAAKDRAEQAEAAARRMVDTVQRSLLPPPLPTIDGLDLGAVYRPAGDGDELGGDFYDAFRGQDGSWFVVVGDVQGKGIEAAIVTGVARDSLRAASVVGSRPSDALMVLNGVLRGAGTKRFVTAAVLRFRQRGPGWNLTFALGGHHRPLICRQGGDAEALGAPGALLGVFDDPTFPESTIQLDPGDLVVVCTDGVLEARRGDELFGDERYRRTVDANRGPAADVATGVLDAVLEFGGRRPTDDIVVVAARQA